MSESGDYEASKKVLVALLGTPREIDGLYILNSRESFHRLAQILESTDELARRYIYCNFFW
jgi:hypothetical protein